MTTNNTNSQHRDPESRLTTKQEHAIVALLHAQTMTRAAEEAGVCERTLNKWLEQPAFNAAYLRARRAAFSQAIALTQKYAALAVNALAQVLTDKSTTSASRVAAAVAVLKFGRDGIQIEDLDARVSALERGQPAPDLRPMQLRHDAA